MPPYTVRYHRRDEYLRFEFVRGVTTLTTLANMSSMIPQHISEAIPDDVRRSYVERLEHPSGGTTSGAAVSCFL